MLEKYVASLLVPYLSKYVENINEDQLKINIWSGKAQLNDLILKPEALNNVLNPPTTQGERGASKSDNGGSSSSASGTAAREADATAATAGASGSNGDSGGSNSNNGIGGSNGQRFGCIPAQVDRGICKNVSLSIPLKRLRSEPVVLEIGEVLITLKGTETGGSRRAAGDSTRCKAALLDAIAAEKERSLEAFEVERKQQQAEAAAATAAEGNAAGSGDGGSALSASKGGFFSRLGELVLNNMIVKVQTVHIRYEEEPSETVLGAILGDVQLVTVNEATGEPMFTDPSGLQKLFKRLVFHDLQVYCDDPTVVRANISIGRCWYTQKVDWASWYHLMRQRVRDGNVGKSTILGPVSGGADVKVVFRGFMRQLLETPYTDISVQLKQVMACLTQAQYTKVLQSISRFTRSTEVPHLLSLRPAVPVHGHAKEMWRYVLRAVSSVLADARRERLLLRVSEVCRLDYQVLYRDVVRQTEMTPEKKKAYRFITRFMTVEDMIAGRKIVYAQIAQEIQLRRKDNEVRKAEAMARQHVEIQRQQEQNRGWWSWMRGRPTVADNSCKDIDEEERFFQTMEAEYGISSSTDGEGSGGSSTGGADDTSFPPSYCWLQASVHLPFVSYRIDTEQGESVVLKLFQLLGGVSTFNKSNSASFFFRTQNITLANPTASYGTTADTHSCGDLVPFLIEGVKVQHRSGKTVSASPQMSMHSLTDIDDGKPPASALLTLSEVLGCDTEAKSAQGGTTSDSQTDTGDEPVSGGTHGGTSPTPPLYATPLFSISGFLNPVEQPLPDTRVDLAVKVQLLPLRIVADPTTIEHLVRFFTPPTGIDVSHFVASTRLAATAVGSAASQELRAAMSRAKGLHITIDASAPIIVLPKTLDATPLVTALSISLGRIRLQARPLSESEKRRRLAASASLAAGTELDESLLYYPHRASFSKCFVELTSIEGAMRRPQRGFLLIPEISFAAEVLQRIDDHSLSREAFILRMKIPALRVAGSLHQTYILTSMMDVWLRCIQRCHQPSPQALVEAVNSGDGLGPPRLTTTATPSFGDGAEVVMGVSPTGSIVGTRGKLRTSMEDSGGAAAAGGAGSTNSTNGGGGVAGVGVAATPAARSALTTRVASPLPAQSAGGASSADLPVMRVELLVEKLGLEMYEDDSKSLLPLPLPVFTVECASGELILAVRSSQTKLLLFLKEPHIVGARDRDYPIANCGAVRVDVLILDGDAPTAVAVSLESAVSLSVGTPLVELLELVMDIVNLIMALISSNDSTGVVTDVGEEPLTPENQSVTSMSRGDGGVASVVGTGKCGLGSFAAPYLSDQAYQLRIVQQLCAMVNRHVADVYIQIKGPATVTVLNRVRDADKDEPFLSAVVRDVQIQLSKYAVTMNLSGCVGEVSVSMLASSGLAPGNLLVLAHTPSPSTASGHSSALPAEDRPSEVTLLTGGSIGSALSATTTNVAATLEAMKGFGGSSGGKPLDCDTENAHLHFTFRKSRPAMPLFKEVEGKRTLVNGQELRYSSALELVVGASTVMVDLHTVMALKTYFVSGLFSRITTVADRPLYNGYTFPPTREGPRLLMSLRVVVRDTLIALPVDPRRDAANRFCASIGNLVLQNSLHTANEQETMGISLGDIGLWREEPCTSAATAAAVLAVTSSPHKKAKSSSSGVICHSLLPSQTYVEIAICNPLDLFSDEVPRIDIRSEDILLSLGAADLVQLCSLTRQNLTRTDDAELQRYMLDPSKVCRIVLGPDGAPLEQQRCTISTSNTSFATSHAAVHHRDDFFLSLRLGKVCVLLSDDVAEGEQSPGNSPSRFQVQSTSVALTISFPSSFMGMRWKSMELNDVRDAGSSTLVLCEEASLHLGDSLTTLNILINDFGVRRSALRSVDPEEWVMSSVSSTDARDNRRRTTGDNSDRRQRGGNAHTSSSHLTSSIQLLTVSALSADFTLRRFAISDQWLALYDLICNEAVVAAWEAPQTNRKASSAAASTSATVAAAAALSAPGTVTSGMRFIISTPSVTIPFLNRERETLIEANIGALLVDVVRLPSATQVAVKVRQLDVVDAVSGERVVSWRSSLRSRAGSCSVACGGANEAHVSSKGDTWIDVWEDADVPFSPLLSQGATAGGMVAAVQAAWESASPTTAMSGSAGGGGAPAAGGPTASTAVGGGTAAAVGGGVSGPSVSSPAVASSSDTAEVMQFIFKSDPTLNRTKIQIAVGELNLLLAMPIINSLIDYFTSPSEPIAKIASLGVMREQRDRMTKAAQQIADTSVLTIQLLWRQPRIVLAGDATQLAKRQRNVEMQLGVMRAVITLDRAEDALSVVVKMQDYNIPSLLKKSTMRLTFKSSHGVETIDLQVERMTVLFHPEDVERLMWVAQRNLLVPREMNYYGTFEKPTIPVASASQRQGARPGEAASTSQRTLQVHVGGLVVAIHDTVGVKTHTLTISSLDAHLSPDGAVEMVVPSFAVMDHFSNRCLLQSETVAPTLSEADADGSLGASPSPSSSPSKATSAAAAAPTAWEGGRTDAAAPPAALRVRVRPMDSATDVQLSTVHLTIIPRGIGILANTFLSIHIPKDIAISAAPPGADRRADGVVQTTAEAPARAAWATAGSGGGPASPTHTFTAQLAECRLRFCRGDKDVATVQLSGISCVTKTYSDESSQLVVKLGNLLMMDAGSAATNYPVVIQPYMDEEATAESKRADGTVKDAAAAEDGDLPKGTLLLYSLETLPPSASPSSAAVSAAPSYARRMRCRVGSLSFILVPDVVRAVGAVLREVQQHVSEGNRDKAYGYVSDKAAATVRRSDVAEQLTAMDVLVHRPYVALVDRPTATKGVQLFPGSLAVKTQLIPPSEDASENTSEDFSSSLEFAPMLKCCTREVFHVEVQRMGMLLLEQSCFRQNCRILVEYQRALMTPPTAAFLSVAVQDTPAEMSSVNVTIPVLAIHFTHEQTNFAMNVLGAFMGGSISEEADGAEGPSTTAGSASVPGATEPGSSAAGRGLVGYKTSLGKVGGSNRLSSPSPPASTALHYASRSTAGGVGSSQSHSRTVLQPTTTASQTKDKAILLSADIGVLEADLAELFRFRVENVLYTSASRTSRGSSISLTLDSAYVRHIGVEVAPARPTASAEAGTTSSRLEEVMELLTVDKLQVSYNQPLEDLDVENASSCVENTMHIMARRINVAISPTILFDTREVLYLPFCYKVLRVPIDPIPVLRLTEETTVLRSDVVLDDKHVLLTSNRTRCCYVLDLNGHALVLTGSPSGQIVLSEGCELTITNGRVCIPGMYTIGSYVSFAALTALSTTDSCIIEKEFLNIPNSQFYGAISPSPHGDPASTRSAGSGHPPRAGSPPTPGDASNTSIGSAAGGGGGAPSLPGTVRESEAATHGVPPRSLSPVGGLRERTVRLLCNFSCEDLQLQMVSEEVVDLSVSLLMQPHVRFIQSTDNGAVSSRNVAVQLLSVRSKEAEEHVLLPTDIMINVSGVDNVSVAMTINSLEFCSRATLLRSLVELGKDFGAAFIEETTVKRVKPTIGFESASLDPLFKVQQAGDCLNCGQRDAFLALAADQPGVLCYKCCTGRDSMPAMDIQIEVSLIDGIVLGSSGSMVHLYLKNALLSVDPAMALQLNVKAMLHGFSNSVVVWEPIIEQFEGIITGNVVTHDYRIRIDRLDYVVSPQSIQLLSNIAADYSSATALQKHLRKRFRRLKEQRAQASAVQHSSAAKYTTAAIIHEDKRTEPDDGDDEAELALPSPVLPAKGVVAPRNLPVLSAPLSAPLCSSIFDQLRTTAESAVDPNASISSRRSYASVFVKNQCSVTLLVDKRPVGPRGAMLRFAADSSTVLVQLERPLSPSDEGYVMSIWNTPLYVHAPNLVIETRVALSQEDGSRHLSRRVTMTIYPLHLTNTIICVENQLNCSLESIGNNSPVLPGERFYVSSNADLNTLLRIQPVNSPDKVDYEAGVQMTSDGGVMYESASMKPKMPTLQEVLCGTTVVVQCRSKSAKAKSLVVMASVRQEEMRGGVPTFVIAIQSRYRLCNRLPYRVIANVVPDVNGALAKGNQPSRPVQPIFSTVLEVQQSADLSLHTYTLGQVAFLLEIRQQRTSSTGGGSSAEAEEVFTTQLPSLLCSAVSFVMLRSSEGRELVVRATYMASTNSITFNAPYALLNHSPLHLTLGECKRNGEIKPLKTQPNFGTLPPHMNACIAASPIDARKSEDFYMNFYHKDYMAACVPLHAQQRGLILLVPTKKNRDTTTASSSSAKKGKTRSTASASAGDATAKVARPPAALHLAYSSVVDANGTLLVTITPRWVLVNRTELTLYAAPLSFSGLNATEAAAEVLLATQTSSATSGAANTSASSSPGAPRAAAAAVSSSKSGSNQIVPSASVGASASSSPDPVAFIVPLGPQTATPLLETPLCQDGAAYHLHVLQSPTAPLYGTPVGIESIHTELMLAYVSLTDTEAASSRRGMVAPAPQDCFVEVSVSGKNSYTYIVLETPLQPPFLLLNRTTQQIEAVDTARRSSGRVMARAMPGCGTELMLDTTVTTVVRFVLSDVDGGGAARQEVCFDLGRTMTEAERKAAMASPNGLHYNLAFSEHGQRIVEVYTAVPLLPIARTSIASPPTPIHLLLNMAIATMAVVMPNQDIVFAALTDARLSWDRQGEREVTQFSIKNFQADNQTEVSPRHVSVVLALRKTEGAAALSGYLERIIVPAKGLICMEEIRLDLVPMALCVTDKFIVSVANFIRQTSAQVIESTAGGRREVSAAPTESAKAVDMREAATATAAAHQRCPSSFVLFAKAPQQIDLWAVRITLERLIINPIIVRFWLTRDVEESDFVRDSINVKEAALLSMMVASCEDVTVAAPGIITAKQSSRLGVLVQWLAKTYVDGLLAQIRGLILQYASSLPLIGAPLKLASGFGNGAVRFFKEPIDGLSTSPMAFATGLARGSAGLAQEFASGGLGAFANLTDTGSRLFSMGGGVSEKERRQQNVFSGFANGLKGIVQRPMAGAAESGATGLMVGAAQGLVGVVANPMSGLLSDVSRATGTLSKLVKDTYIPQTQRLRPIRDFYANGGVAPWRSLLSVYRYERLQVGTKIWSGGQLMSTVDGPEWYPCPRESVTYGAEKKPVPAERWTLDRHQTSFDGWVYGIKYYGVYREGVTPQMRVRRKRWAALVRPLPYSRISFLLRVSPGMEVQPRQTSRRVNSADASPTGSPQLSTHFSTQEFVAPGVANAELAGQVPKSHLRNLFDLLPHSPHHHRSDPAASSTTGSGTSRGKDGLRPSTGFLIPDSGGQQRSLKRRMQSWTASGRHTGVRGSHFGGDSCTFLNEEDDSCNIGSTSGSPLCTSRAAISSTMPEFLDPQEAPTRVKSTYSSRHQRLSSSGRSDSRLGSEGPSSPLQLRQASSRHVQETSAAAPPPTLGVSDALPALSSRTGSDRLVAVLPPSSATGSRPLLASTPEAMPSPILARLPTVRLPGTTTDTAASTTDPAAPVATAAQVPSAETQLDVVTVYEYERKMPIIGWGKRCLPPAYPPWQDGEGHVVPKRQEMLPPAGWVWSAGWVTVGGDRDGWTAVQTDDTSSSIRRRKWQRRIVRQQGLKESTLAAASSTSRK